MFHLSRVWCMRQQSRLTLLRITYSRGHIIQFSSASYIQILVSKDSQPSFFVEGEWGSCTSMQYVSLRSLSYYRSTAASKECSPQTAI